MSKSEKATAEAAEAATTTTTETQEGGLLEGILKNFSPQTEKIGRASCRERV